jgi:alpha-beta hydrolase superfamily lysophospholipase
MNHSWKLVTFVLLLAFCANVFSQDSESKIKEEELTFQSNEAVYSGTLSMPAEKSACTAVILLSGTGPQDRDWPFNRGTYKMAKMITEHLNKNGIAVYRFDDRGVGKSTGTAESETSFSDLAEDIVVAVNTLRKRDDIKQVGLLGHSLGGILSVIVASEYKNVDFIISLAGSFRTGENILREQARTMKLWRTAEGQTDEEVIANGDRFADNLVKYFQTGEGLDSVKTILTDLIKFQISNLSEDLLKENLKYYKDVDEFQRKSVEGALKYYTSPHKKSYITYDASEDFPKVACPVCVIFGGADKHVTIKSNKPPLIRALNEAKTKDFTLKIIDDADHGFSTSELVQKGEMLPEVLDFMSNWILARAD